MACCLILSASANPPARLGVGVFLPLSVPLPPFKLRPESRGAGTGAGFRPAAAGRLAGGAGGAGFPRAAVPFVGGAGGPGRTTGGGGGGACSARYADGAQP